MNLQVNLRPALESPRGQVDVERVVPVAQWADLRRVRLSLAFDDALEHSPIVT